MSDFDNWRAEQAAQLAGTPFARPVDASLDRTLPMQTAAVIPPVTERQNETLVAPRGRLRMPWPLLAPLPIAIVAFLLLRDPTSPEPQASRPARAAAPLAIAAPSTATGTVPPAAIAPAPAIAPSNQATATTVPAARVSSAAHLTASRFRQIHRKAHDPAVTRSQDRTSLAPVRPTGSAPVPSRVKAIATLPICQPQNYSRTTRPCRPSHDRYVRKPFFTQ